MLRLLVFIFLVGISSVFAEKGEEAPPPPVEPQEQTTPLEPVQNMDAMSDSYESAFIKMMLTLGALLLLIALSVYMLRKFSSGKFRGGSSSRTMKILERKPLSAKSVLYLIEVEGKKVLIAESQLEVRTITTIEAIAAEE